MFDRISAAQTELMAAQYDEHLASEALRSSQERINDLSFHLEDGENRVAEAEAAAAHAQSQAAAADDACAEAEARAASLGEQVRSAPPCGLEPLIFILLHCIAHRAQTEVSHPLCGCNRVPWA